MVKPAKNCAIHTTKIIIIKAVKKLGIYLLELLKRKLKILQDILDRE